MKQLLLRRAQDGDIPQIEALLAAERLPPFLVREFLETFWALEQDGRVVGAAGLEPYGEAGVLRSVVVDPSLRGTRQGRRLVDTALAEARQRGVRRLYLFTMHAAPFFARCGFETCSMEDFEREARQSWQWQALSERPEIAKQLTPMRLELGAEGP